MAKAAQIRGMVLEEVILALLSASGFRTITHATDPTLAMGPSGMEVLGRASRHQIDAVANFGFAMPFTYPARLLVEGKCYKKDSVGIEVIRNAIGVLKDVNEFFDPHVSPPLQRWHYQYAVFSATRFSPSAADYAYAHDIYPVPLSRVSALEPILREIQAIDDDVARQLAHPLHRMRQTLRDRFNDAVEDRDVDLRAREEQNPLADMSAAIANSLRTLGGALLARLASGLPLFLVPQDREALRSVLELTNITVQIRFARHEGWWIESEQQGRLLNFDLPREVFETHDEAGMFRGREAIRFKEEQLATLQAVYAPPDKPPRLVVLNLSPDWVQEIRRGLRIRG